MESEVTRASDADRQRYVEHLSTLFADGYIKNRAEAEQLRTQLLEARSVSVLKSTMSGYPLPPMPRQRRDWGIPERWAPITIAAGVLGVFIAAVPTAALAHHGDSFANMLTAAFLAIGIVMVVVAIIAGICFACSWENIGASERARRREADRNRRLQDRKD